VITLGGVQANRVRLHVPLHGVPVADVELVNATALANLQTLVVGDLSLQGTIVSGGVAAEVASYHWVAGRASWGVTLPARGYQSALGVLRSSILQDLQTDLAVATSGRGDTVAIGIPEQRVGPIQSGYARPAGPAWDTLKTLRVPWYVDVAGVTQIRERTGIEVPATVDVLQSRPDEGSFVVASRDETYSRWLPGNLIAGARIVSLTLVAVPGEPTRMEIFTARTSPSHEIRTALEDFVRQEMAYGKFWGRYEYRVNTRDGDSYGLVPASPTAGMPKLDSILMRPGIAGFKADLVVGQSVSIGFENGDPARPFIIHYQPLYQGAPERVYIDADRVDLGGATELVARETDMVIGPAIRATQDTTTQVAAISFEDAAGRKIVISFASGLMTGILTAGPFVPPPSNPLDVTISEYVIGTPAQDKVFA
jgi:hypothetical protein